MGDDRDGDRDEQSDAAQQRPDEQRQQAGQEQHDDGGDMLVDERETRLDRVDRRLVLIEHEVRVELREERHHDRPDELDEPPDQRDDPDQAEHQLDDSEQQRGQDDGAQELLLEEDPQVDLALGGGTQRCAHELGRDDPAEQRHGHHEEHCRQGQSDAAPGRHLRGLVDAPFGLDHGRGGRDDGDQDRGVEQRQHQRDRQRDQARQDPGAEVLLELAPAVVEGIAHRVRGGRGGGGTQRGAGGRRSRGPTEPRGRRAAGGGGGTTGGGGGAAPEGGSGAAGVGSAWCRPGSDRRREGCCRSRLLQCQWTDSSKLAGPRPADSCWEAVLASCEYGRRDRDSTRPPLRTERGPSVRCRRVRP